MIRILLWSLAIFHLSFADIYLHNPRGSNNRLDESNRNVRNARRLFDSENNNRGGYNVGNVFYYTGSELQFEWTNQHSCNGPNSNCNIVLQYMCGDNVRDGSTTQTIPENQAQCENNDCNTDLRYGLNEEYENWLTCRTRSRNRGLFTADQNLRGGRKRARHTRQQSNGQRYGYECNEERDYYPYWHPSPWRDIAIMTDDVSRCPYYLAESENVKGRYFCDLPLELLEENRNRGNFLVPNNQEDCEAFTWPKNDPAGQKGVWTLSPSHGIPAPVCQEAEYSRDNHNGNGLHGTPNLFNWTLPDTPMDNCVFRIRYNISTGDFDSWNTFSEANHDGPGQPTKVDIATNVGLTAEEAANRGYVFEGNPTIQVFKDVDVDLAIALNTAQYGRTFQDRSFVFDILERPSDIPASTKIYNLNVRGKRGNIVEVYPSVEYDFVPNDLHVSVDDYVHIQWTGSNTNNNGNDGQGLRGSDRSNMVLMGPQVYPEGNGVYNGPGVEIGHYGVNYPRYIHNISGITHDRLYALAYVDPGQYGGEMSELDDAGTYFNLDPFQIKEPGTYHYMCTRNNNFSNRDQKGRLIVHPFPVAQRSIGAMGGSVAGKNSKIEVEEKVFNELRNLILHELTIEQGNQEIEAKKKQLSEIPEQTSENKS